MAEEQDKPADDELRLALDAEKRRSAELAASMEELQRTMHEIRQQLSAELEDAKRRFDKSEKKLLDQSERLDALGNGREETMRQLQETRDELNRVSRERDELQKRVTTIADMQTETLALPEDADPTQGNDDLPSIDELMINLSEAIEDKGDRSDTLGAGPVETADEDWQEMLAPELILPEAFSEPSSESAAASGRLLVLLGAEQPIKYPLFKETMTIGRSEVADIRIDGDFISRIHTRIVVSDHEVAVEDAGSKNGTKVNSSRTGRQVLKHGDIIGIGRQRLTYVEMAPDDE